MADWYISPGDDLFKSLRMILVYSRLQKNMAEMLKTFRSRRWTGNDQEITLNVVVVVGIHFLSSEEARKLPRTYKSKLSGNPWKFTSTLPRNRLVAI